MSGYKQPLEKQPAEVFTVGWDFENDLGAGESINGAAVSATNVTEGGDAGNDILDGNYSVDGTRVLQKIKGGSDDILYKITIRAITDAGHTFEGDISMNVKDL